jgi:hypothetical protein
MCGYTTKVSASMDNLLLDTLPLMSIIKHQISIFLPVTIQDKLYLLLRTTSNLLIWVGLALEKATWSFAKVVYGASINLKFFLQFL